MQNAPKVSVLLTSYNQGKYLREAIDSVLNQTFTDFELIISDDCSTDNSWEIIQSYNDPRIIKIRHEKNLGYQLTQDIVDMMRGEYFALQHSDDVWVSEKLEKQVKFMEKNRKYGACFTFVQYIDENSNLWIESEGHNNEKLEMFLNHFNQDNRNKYEWLKYLFYEGNHFCHPSLLIRKNSVPKHSFNHLIGYIQMPDYASWVEFCMYNDIYIYPEKLINFRMRKDYVDNVSGMSIQNLVRSKYEQKKVLEIYKQIETFDTLRKIFPQLPVIKDATHVDVLYWVARIAYEVNDRSYWLFAHDIIFDLLNDDVSRGYLSNKYTFNRKQWRDITEKYDIFSVKNNINCLHTILFYGCNSGFEKQIKQDVLINEAGEFVVKFDLLAIEGIKTIIFNPTNRMIRMKLIKLMINGFDVELKKVRNNSSKICNNMEEFYHVEPQYWIEEYSELITEVCIQGMVDFNININEYCNEINEENIRLKAEIESIKNTNVYKIEP